MMNQLTISLDAGLSLEESDLGSETSSGYCDSVPPFLEPQYQVDGAAVAQQSAFFVSPMGTMSPTFYPASPAFCEQALYCDPGYEDPLQGVQFEDSSLMPVVPLPTGVPQTQLTSPPLTVIDPPSQSAQDDSHIAVTSTVPTRSTERPQMPSDGNLGGDTRGGLLTHASAPATHQDNQSTAATDAPVPPSASLDPPVLTPLPGSKSWAAPTNWAEAKEFVPKVKVEKPRSWAQVVNTGITYPGCELTIAEAESLLCPFFRVGECRLALRFSNLVSLLSLPGMAWVVPMFMGSSVTTVAKLCFTPLTWIRGGGTWLSAFKSMRGTWSSALLWQGARRRHVASAWRLSLTSRREKQGKSRSSFC